MKIEKNIPIPDNLRNGEKTATLRAMDNGDSIVIPFGTDLSWRSSARAIGVKILVRKISDTKSRLWRIK